QHPVQTDGLSDDGGPPEVSRLRRRLDRERATREEAERISERATRALYDRQVELELLEAVAQASNEARTLGAALQVAIDAICVHTDWPVGHAYIAADDGLLHPAEIWNTQASAAYNEFKRITAQFSLAPGAGLPGRIAETGEPLWIRDVLEDPNFPRAQHAAALGVHAAFGFPVKVGER